MTSLILRNIASALKKLVNHWSFSVAIVVIVASFCFLYTRPIYMAPISAETAKANEAAQQKYDEDIKFWEEQARVVSAQVEEVDTKVLAAEEAAKKAEEAATAAEAREAAEQAAAAAAAAQAAQTTAQQAAANPTPTPPPANYTGTTAGIQHPNKERHKQIESGGNYSIVGGGGAYLGAYQFAKQYMPARFERWMGYPYPGDAAFLADPAAQDLCADGYMYERYGSWDNVPAYGGW